MTRRLIIAAFGVMGVMAALVALVMMAPDVGATTSWQQVYVPNSGPAGQSAQMLSPTCFTASDCMAVVGHSLAHFTGDTWSTATPATTTNLSSASCLSDLWCMGAGYSTNDTPEAALWNGTSWTQYEPPVPAGVDADEASFAAVGCASTQDCWALGTYYGDEDGLGDFQQFADQWNGTTWTSVVMTYQPGFGVQPNGIDCSSDGTCEAVGWYETDTPTEGTEYTLTEKYTGSQWVAQTSPSPGGTDNDLDAVTCVSDTDCTAVGSYSTYFVADSVGQQSLIEHYNGSTWTEEPDDGFQGSTLLGVTCNGSSSGDVCEAVGSYNGPFIEHGVGATWAQESVPNPGGVANDSLAGVSCPSAGVCMAVGREVLGDEFYGPLALTTEIGPFAPGVSHLSETASPLSGGDTVTIIGAGFSAGAGTPVVQFGTIQASDVTVLGDDQLTATVPASATPIAVDVTVATSIGTSPLTPSDRFSFLGQPVVSGVSPTTGSGFTTVTVTGSGLQHVSEVDFGSTDADFSTVSDTQLTAYAPYGPSGTVDVTVTSPGGTSDSSSSDRFTYAPVPEVDGLTPGFGPQAGGTPVVLRGSGFNGATEVDLSYSGDCDCDDDLQPDSYTVVSNSEIDFVTPAANFSGIYQVSVTGPGGTSGSVDFNYGGSPPPAITSLSPLSGPVSGGNSVKILGSGFTGTTEIDLESLSGDFETSVPTYTVVNNTEIDVTMPADEDEAPDIVDLSVQSDNGVSQRSLAAQYTYLGSSPPPPPTVTEVSPSSGTEDGTCGIVIAGTGFNGATTVQFGADLLSSSFVVDSSTQITACAPISSSGPVDVVVTAIGGTSAVTPADTFTYLAPSVTSVSPATCTDDGGCTVLITGSGFTDDDGVRFGSTGADWADVIDSNTIVAIAPPAPDGTDEVVDVAVEDDVTASQIVAADQFTYSGTTPAPPAIEQVTPASGPSAGGDTVEVDGEGFTDATGVDFGSTPGTDVNVESPFSLTVTTPAGSGTVDVTVTGPGGTSGIGPQDQFVFDPAPVISAVSPPEGPLAGGTTVTISGSGLGDTDSVGIDPVDPADGPTDSISNFTVVNDNEISFITPAGFTTPEVADLVVVTPGGTSATSLSDQFTYVGSSPPAPPVVSSVAPASGSVGGGEQVTITGTGLSNAIDVQFGVDRVSHPVSDSPTQITVTSPGGPPGAVDVVVTAAGGTSAASGLDRYTFASAPPPQPVITGLTPSSGTPMGGETVSITGTNFTGVTAVDFGTVAATNLSITSSTLLTVTAPTLPAGTVDVTVVGPGGTSATSPVDRFTVAGSWKVVDSGYASLPPIGANALLGVSCVDSTDCWSVGDHGVQGANGPIEETLIEHFDGQSWATVSSPDPMAPGSAHLDAVSCLSATDCLAVGAQSSVGPGDAATQTTVLVAQWNGTVWSEISAPNPSPSVGGNQLDELSSVSCAAAPSGAQCLAVGDVANETTGAVSPLAESFDGSTWTVVPAANPSAMHAELSSVSCIGGASIWCGAVGDSDGGPLAESGSAAGLATSPITSSPADAQALNAVSCSAEDACVAVGDGAATPVATVVVVDVAGTWTAAAGPAPGDRSDQLNGISCSTASNCTAVGSYTNEVPSVTSTWVEHFDGQSWSQTTSQSPGSSRSALNAVSCVPTTSCWGVGGANELGGNNDLTLAETPTPPTLKAGVPSVLSVTPDQEPATSLSSLTLTGTGFTGASAVTFGGVSTPFTVESPTTIEVTAPAQPAGTVDVQVTNAAGESEVGGADLFTYAFPLAVVTGDLVDGGVGEPYSAQLVAFGGVGSMTWSEESGLPPGLNLSPSGAISGTPTADDAGPYPFTVDVVDGAAETATSNLRITITGSVPVGSPTVSEVSPPGGVVGGGTLVTIDGTNLMGVSKVTFGGVNSPSVVPVSNNEVQALAPPGSGVADIRVTSSAGTSLVSVSDQYHYVAVAPQVAALSPVNGPVSGGTAVVIVGSGFHSALFPATDVTGVRFGSIATTSFTVVNDTTISAVAPAGVASSQPVAIVADGLNWPSGDSFNYVPTVSGLEPTDGLVAGGTSVTVTGTGFSAASSVLFGSTPAASYTVVSDTQIVAVSPPGTVGSFDVTVSGAGGPSPTRTVDRFAYATQLPTVLAVSPNQGLVSGGNTISVAGAGFGASPTVVMGSGSATVLSETNGLGTVLTVLVPPGAAGSSDVRVIQAPGVESPVVPNDAFTYYRPATVTGLAFPAPGTTTPVSPQVTGVTGTSQVTISGTGFSVATGVTIAGTEVPFQIVSATKITATTVTGSPVPSVANVVVSATPGGPATGGTNILVTGSGFNGASAVQFSSTPATSFSVVSDNLIIATSPVGAGLSAVTVTNPVSVSNSTVTFRYQPVVTSMLYRGSSIVPCGPCLVPVTGGGTINIHGQGLGQSDQYLFEERSGNTIVWSASASAAHGFSASPTSVFVTAPPGPVKGGTVDLLVINGGTSQAVAADQVHYVVPPPTLSLVSPSYAPATGGETVNVDGSGFTGAISAAFTCDCGAKGATISLPATNLTVYSDTELSVGVPGPDNAGDTQVGEGTMTLTVSTNGGPSALGLAFNFQPVVTSVSTASGPIAGGTSVTVHGVGFAWSEDGGSTSVNFDYLTSTIFGSQVLTPAAVVSSTGSGDTSLVVLSPAVGALTPVGPADIVVTTPGGSSAISPVDQFTYTTAASAPQAIAAYRVVGSDGGLFSYGSASYFGSLGGVPLNQPITGMAQTPDGHGYWLVAKDGGIFSFGDAAFYGSTGNVQLNQPIVGMAATTDGHGYWLVAKDGGIFSFGDAAFYGSTGNVQLNQAITGMAQTPDGHGYWLVAKDGGIFSFGDAAFYGSTGNVQLNQPIVGMAATTDGHGYWLVAKDGGIYAFGDAPFMGSLGAHPLDQSIVGMAATPDGGGYWLVGADGGVYALGDAPFLGAPASTGAINQPIVGMAP